MGKMKTRSQLTLYDDNLDLGRIIHVRETRLTSCFSHILIGLSILLLPYPLAYIPRPVLDGIFLYLVATAVQNNQMFERVLLLVTEQVSVVCAFNFMTSQRG